MLALICTKSLHLGPDTIRDFHLVSPASASHHCAWKFQVGQISDPASILALTQWVPTVMCM